jgi:hypothetical protein
MDEAIRTKVGLTAYTVQSLTLTATVGSVATTGPAGVNRSDTTTYAPAGYDPVYGARPLRRLIQRELEGDIARAMLARTIPEGGTIRVTLDHGAMHVECVDQAAAAAV